MEAVIQETLSKGVEMHVAGEFDLAIQLYSSVIKLDPNHADANHNMGLLKVDMGDALEALPYLQTALQADTSVALFWLSYIKALLQIGRMDEANRVLRLAKESGAECEEFLELYQRLNEPTFEAEQDKTILDTLSQSKQNILGTLKLDKALRLAKSKVKKGSPEQAKRIYKDILEKFPNNRQAQKGLKALNKLKQPASIQGPPQDTINQLINLYNQGKLREVVGEAHGLIEQYPETFIIWNILGAANKGLGRVQASSEAFKKVTELSPTYADGFSNLGTCLQDLGELDEAIASYNKALSLKPDHPEAHYNMGLALKDQGKLAEAIESFSKALAIKPDNAEAFNNMGATLNDQGKFEEAIEAYNKALLLKPDYAVAFYNLGSTLKDQDNLEDAIAAFNKALSLKPDFAEALNNIGNALKDQGKLEEAIASYNKALSLKPDYADVYNNIGNAFRDQGKLEEAIASYSKALSAKPDYAEAFNNMGNALKDQGKLEEAIVSYNKALSLNHEYAEAYSNIGNAFKDQGKLEEAIASYNKALSAKPDYAEVFNNMGTCLQDQGKLEEAIASYNKALSLKHDYALAARNLVKLPIGSIDKKTISKLNKKLSLISANIDDQSQKLFFEANVFSHKGMYDEAFKIFVDANYVRSQKYGYSKKLHKKRHDAVIKRIRSWSVNLPSEEKALVKKLFLLGPSRSGKSTLEKLLIRSPNVCPMFENINFRATDESERSTADAKKPSMVDLFYYDENSLSKLGYNVVTSTDPETMFQIDRLIDLVNNSFCIFVKRNRNDIASEIFTREYENANDYSYDHSNILEYLDTYEAIWEIIKYKIPHLTLEITFEDILSEPQEAIKQISQLIGVKFDVSDLRDPLITNLASPFREHYASCFMVP